jgi:L-iditol 2-dehydrogenase|tara:strand:- start:254 stop:1321 length:1068 start_codon:yes stop_codon:yes gene_type:complete
MTANITDNNIVVSCKGGDATAIEIRQSPNPGPGEILLKLSVVGFCGTDLFKLTSGSVLPGTVLGHEMVGQIIAVGKGVKKFHLGDRIVVPHHVPCGFCLLCRRGNETMCDMFREELMEPGAFANQILIRARAVEQAAYYVPNHLSDEAAVFLEPAACVLRSINRAELIDDSTAVIIGAGSMGLLHLLVLKAILPRITVTVIDPVKKRRSLARSLGAEKAIAPDENTFSIVQTATNGLGADAAFDTVGGSTTLKEGLLLTRQGGIVVLFAHAQEEEQAGVNLNSVFKYERKIIGTYSASLKEQSKIFELLSSGTLDPSQLVTHKMSLDEFSRGVGLVKNQQALKVIFTPSKVKEIL